MWSFSFHVSFFYYYYWFLYIYFDVRLVCGLGTRRHCPSIDHVLRLFVKVLTYSFVSDSCFLRILRINLFEFCLLFEIFLFVAFDVCGLSSIRLRFMVFCLSIRIVLFIFEVLF